SLTADTGRWITSPAAIRFTTDSSRRWIVGGSFTATNGVGVGMGVGVASSTSSLSSSSMSPWGGRSRVSLSMAFSELQESGVGRR
ncbi:hypothetical protein U1Q18_036919, partial [Sarracenia purpurea var. burkii]